jgi:hypothetical protein
MVKPTKTRLTMTPQTMKLVCSSLPTVWLTETSTLVRMVKPTKTRSMMILQTMRLDYFSLLTVWLIGTSTPNQRETAQMLMLLTDLM